MAVHATWSSFNKMPAVQRQSHYTHWIHFLYFDVKNRSRCPITPGSSPRLGCWSRKRIYYYSDAIFGSQIRCCVSFIIVLISPHFESIIINEMVYRFEPIWARSVDEKSLFAIRRNYIWRIPNKIIILFGMRRVCYRSINSIINEKYVFRKTVTFSNIAILCAVVSTIWNRAYTRRISNLTHPMINISITIKEI